MAHDLSEGEQELIRLARLATGDPAARPYAITALRSLWDDSASSAASPARHVAIFAVGAALTVKIPAILGANLGADTYVANIGMWVMAWAIAMFGARSQWRPTTWSKAGLVLTALLVFVNAVPNVIPDGGSNSTLPLIGTHLPIALWFALGAARAGIERGTTASRLDFIRFSGEAFFYFALLALGGGVLMAISYQMFASLSSATQTVIGGWLLPCGAAGSVVVAAWLADSSERVMGRIALVVQRVFTPLFAVVMGVFTVTAVPGGFLTTFSRDTLSVYDALLVVVTSLALYGVAAQSEKPVHRLHDSALLAMVATGVTTDLLIVIAMVDRTLGFGFSANRVAATGLNLVLLANLAGLAVRQWRRVRGSDPGAPAQWAAAYLPVLAGWAAFVAIALPLLFWGK